MRLEHRFQTGFSELQEIIWDEKQKIRAGERKGRAAPGSDRVPLEKLRAEAARRGMDASEIFFEEALESAEPENCLFRYFFLCPP